MAKKKEKQFVVETPVANFSGISWGIPFVGGKSLPFKDEKLYRKLKAKGYKGNEITTDEKKLEKENPDNSAE